MQDIKYYFNDFDGNIAIKKCNNSIHASKTHFHKEISVALVEDGHSKVQICDEIFEITGRTFLMIPSNVVHRCTPVGYSNWKFRMLYINKVWFENAYNCSSENFNFSFMKVDKSMYLDMVSLFDNIENCMIDLENESKMIYYISLLMDVTNNYNKKYSEDMTEKVRIIKDFIEENYLSNIMINDLSRISDMSKYSLIRQFENSLGLSPHKFIINLRVNYAKNLLKGNKNLSEIALESAFYDQSHFIKCFKEYTGVTPKKYRK